MELELEVDDIKCAECGGDAMLYPYPVPKGTCFCPKCSPTFLKAFLEDMTEKARRLKEKGKLEEVASLV